MRYKSCARIKWTNRRKVQKRNLLTAIRSGVSFGLLTALLPATALAQTQLAAVPPAITPPSGNTVYLTAHAMGTQNYLCLPSASGNKSAPVWMFIAPQATLSIVINRFTQQVSTHFLSPVPTAELGSTFSGDHRQMNAPAWQSSFDSSMVWGSKIGSVNAGSNPSCPNAGAIPCLLLKAVANRPAHFGAGLFARTTYIQRLNTSGGAAPTTSCKIGDLALVSYSADYSFYAAEHEKNGL